MTLATFLPAFLNSHAGTYLKITESTINTVILILSVHGNHKFAKVYSAKCILTSNSPKFATAKVSLYMVSVLLESGFTDNHVDDTSTEVNSATEASFEEELPKDVKNGLCHLYYSYIYACM